MRQKFDLVIRHGPNGRNCQGAAKCITYFFKSIEFDTVGLLEMLMIFKIRRCIACLF